MLQTQKSGVPEEYELVQPRGLAPHVDDGLVFVKPGGGLVGAVVFLGTFHSSWEREACVWEIGPEDHVDLMSDNLPATQKNAFVHF